MSFTRVYNIITRYGPKDNATVSDEFGNIVYTAKPRFSFIRNAFVIKDNNSKVVAKVMQKISLIVPAYEIRLNDQPLVHIKRKLGFCVCYKIKGKPWEVVTDSNCEKYYVRDIENSTIYEIEKDLELLRHNYKLTVVSEDDPLLGTCIVIAIDLAMRAITKK